MRPQNVHVLSNLSSLFEFKYSKTPTGKKREKLLGGGDEEKDKAKKSGKKKKKKK